MYVYFHITWRGAIDAIKYLWVVGEVLLGGGLDVLLARTIFSYRDIYDHRDVNVGAYENTLFALRSSLTGH